MPTDPCDPVLLLPKDTNAYGTIFGGVILSNIDLASAVEARKLAPHRYVTKAMHEVEFHEPVFVGDLVSFYTETVRVGRTSVTVRVLVEAERWGSVASDETRRGERVKGDRGRGRRRRRPRTGRPIQFVWRLRPQKWVSTRRLAAHLIHRRAFAGPRRTAGATRTARSASSTVKPSGRDVVTIGSTIGGHLLRGTRSRCRR
jgi:acyl-CoA hydrolase